MGSQVIGEDRSRLLGRGTAGEVRRGGRREYTDLGLDSSASAEHHALRWRLMRPKGMENLAAFSAFSAREVKRAAAEERERKSKSK